MSKWTAQRILFLVACVLFVIASLISGGIINSLGSYVPWTLGGFAAVALAWVNP